MARSNTATSPAETARAAQIATLLRSLTDDVRGVRGALVATNDGHSVGSSAIDNDAATAAIVASSRGLGERLAELCGGEPLQEIVVRSASGYAVVYSAGSNGALTVLTDASANLALLHLRAREVTSELKEMLDADLEI